MRPELTSYVYLVITLDDLSPVKHTPSTAYFGLSDLPHHFIG